MTRHDEIRKIMKEHYHGSGLDFEIRGPLTVVQVEQESLEELRKSQREDIPPVPFGFINDRWNELKSRYEEGDELYFFTSDQRSWANLNGIEGYVLIRKNKVLDGIVTAMN